MRCDSYECIDAEILEARARRGSYTRLYVGLSDVADFGELFRRSRRYGAALRHFWNRRSSTISSGIQLSGRTLEACWPMLCPLDMSLLDPQYEEKRKTLWEILNTRPLAPRSRHDGVPLGVSRRRLHRVMRHGVWSEGDQHVMWWNEVRLREKHIAVCFDLLTYDAS